MGTFIVISLALVGALSLSGLRKSMDKTLYLILLLALLSIGTNLRLQAAAITNVATGNWNAPATWPNTTRSGTISTLTTSTGIVGIGTAFLTEISVGNIIKTTGNVVIGTVTSITDNTHLTLAANAASTNTNIGFNSQGVGSGDAVTISGAFNVTVNIATAACASIQVGAATTGTLTFNSGSQLTVNGAITMGGTATGTITMTAGGTLICNGFTVGNTASTFTSGTGTIQLNASNTLPTTVFLTFNNLTTTSGTTKLGTNITKINGNLSLQTGSTLNMDVFSILSAGGASALSIDATSILQLGQTSNFPSVFFSYTFSPGSTVNYNGVNQNVAAQNYSNLILSNSGTKTLQGAITPTGDITVTSCTFDLQGFTVNRASSGGTLSIDATSTLKIGGPNTFPSNYATNTLSTGSTVNYTGTGTNQSIAVQSYSNLTVSGGGTKTLAGTISPTGNLTITGSTLDLGTFTADRSATGGSISIDATSTLMIGGTNTSFPANYTTRLFTAGSLVNYYGTNQTVAANGNNYSNLTLSGSGIKTFGTGVANVNLVLSMEGTATTAAIGSLTYSAGATLQYKGSAAQTSGPELPASISNLIINNSNGVTLSSNISVATALTLTSGILTMGSNTLTISSSSGLISGGSSSSYIDGALSRTLVNGTTFAYPVGSSSCGFHQLTLSNLNVLANTVMKVVFACTGATTGDGTSIPTPQAINWDLKYISGTFTTGDVKLEGNEIDLSSSMASATAQAGVYSKVTATAAVGSITASGIGAIASDKWLSIAGPRTYYSYQSGSWTAASSTWTQDPSGTLQVGSSIPSDFDVVYILPGRTVTLPSDISFRNLDITIEAGGYLDMSTFKFTNTLKALSGEGTLLLASVNFPTVTTNSFINAGGGTTEYYNSGNFTLPSTQLTYNNLNINTSSSNYTATQLSNLTLNGNLSIKNGIFRINDNSSTTKLSLTVNGNVTVNTTGQIAVGQGVTNVAIGSVTSGNYYNQFHTVTFNGDFTNNGTVKFTNLTYPIYNAFPAGPNSGAATVIFKGSTDNTLSCKGTTIFYNLIEDKGTDQTYQLTINSTAYPNFQLYGANSLATDGAVTSNPNLQKALWIKNGTLNLQGSLIIPSLSEGTTANSDYYIPLTGALVLDGTDVVVFSTAEDYQEVNRAYGGLSGPNSATMGVTVSAGFGALDVFGKLQINNGYLSTRESAGVITTSTASGQIEIDGGVLDAKQFLSTGASSSYTQTGGYFLLRGRFQRTPTAYSSIANLSDYSTATLSTVRSNSLLLGTSGSFNLTATTNFAMTGGTIRIYDVCGDGTTAAQQKAFDVLTSSSNINVSGGTLEIFPTSGTVLTDSPIFSIITTATMGSLTVNRASGTGTVQLNTNPLTLLGNFTLTNGIFDANSLDLKIAGDVTIQSGTTFTTGSNTTTLNGSGSQIFTVNLASALSLNKFTISKSAGTSVTFAGSQTTINVNDNFNLTLGTLNDNGNTIKLFKNVYNSGLHAGTGKISLVGTVAQTIDGAGIFQNLELNNATSGTAPVSLIANTTVNGALTFSQNKLFNIGTYGLTLGASATIVNGSSTRYIQTAGTSGDGGVTRYFSSPSTFTYPIGCVSTSHPSAPTYTPASIGFNSAPSSYGSITITPVGYEHPATTTNGQSLTYFWRVKSSGIVLGTAKVTHGYTYSQSDVVTGTNISEDGYVAARFNSSTYTWSKGTATDVDETQNIIGEPNTGSFLDNTTFIDGDYTAGDDSPTDPFTTPRKFYSRASGGWSVATTWSFTDNNGTANTSGATPGANDIVIIAGNDNITLTTSTSTINTGSVSCAILQIENGSTLDIGNNPGSVFSMVLNHPSNTNGLFRVTTTISSPRVFVFPSNSDFSDFNAKTGTTEYYSSDPNSGTKYYLPANVNSYGNLIMRAKSSGNIVLPNTSVTIHGDLTCVGDNTSAWTVVSWYDATLYNTIEKTVHIEGNLNINNGTFIFLADYQPQHIIVDGNINLVAGSTISHQVPGYINQPPKANTIEVGGSFTNNGTVSLRVGTTTIYYVDLTFSGTNNGFLTNTAGTPTTTLNKVTINKGSSQASTCTFNIGGTLTTQNDAWLTLKNGTLIYNRTGDLNISTTTDFVIPTTSGLTINSSSNIFIANSATNNENLFLDGRMTLINGNVYIGPKNNTANNADIEYSSSGSSAIVVQGGNLYVNGQIRRPLSTTNGVLSYSQSNGNVSIFGNNPLASNLIRAKLEIANSGSSFTMNGGSLYIVRGGGYAANYGDLYLRPETSNVTGGTIYFTQTAGGTSTLVDAVQTYSMDSNTPLYNLTITGKTAATARNATLSLMVNPLTLLGNLTLTNANSIFTSNNNDVTIGGNLSNTGTYNFGTNTTTFNGSVQSISGTTVSNFYDLIVSPTTSLTPSSSFTVNNNLTISNGVLALASKQLTLKGNLINNGSYTDNNITGSGVSLSGTTIQQSITGTGSYGRLELNNPFGAAIGNDVSLTSDLVLTQGILDISSYNLVLSQNSSISGSPFSSAKMIKTDGVASAAGITKFFASGASVFTFPVGVTGKYTPAVYNVTANTNAGSITVAPVNAYHPTALDANNVLHYYWRILSSGITGFTGTLTLQYLATDVYGTESNYIGAYLANPGDYWYKGFTVTPSLHQISFPSTSSNNLSADYTAGKSIALPDQVPTYRSNKNGNWSDNTIWTAVGSSPACPVGGPNGSIVIIDNTVSTSTNYCSAYRTTINGTLKVVSPTYGHNLGIVDGSGTLYMETGNLPAGDYTAFLDCLSNATLEYGGSGTYTNIASLYSSVPNLVFSGTGTRVLYDRDLTICKRLVINGPTLDNSVNNRSFFIEGTMERYGTGAFLSGSGTYPAATVSFTGAAAQALGGSTGDFIGSNGFNNLEISNSSGLTVSTGGQIEVNNKLLLTNGKITTSSTNQLKIVNTASDAVIPTGGSSTSYIDGPLIKQIVNGESFLFPLGKGSVFGHDFTLTSAAGSTAYWTAEYFTPNANTNLTSPLQDITALEYWAVNGASTMNAYAKIGWDNLSGLVAAVTINGMSDMRLAEFNTGTNSWTQVGTAATAVTTGSLNVGDVTSTTPISISTTAKKYTIASISLAKSFARFTSSTDVCGTAGIPITFTQFPSTPINLPYKLDYSINGVAQSTINIASVPYTLPTSSAGTYLLTGFQYTNGGGTFSTGTVTSTSVIDYASPTTAVAGANQAVCSLSAATLAANTPSVPNASAGIWSIVSGSGGNFGNNLSPTSSFTGILGNSYNLRWTISNNSCKSSSNVTISFLVAPAMPSSFIATVPTACNVSTANIYTVPAITGNTYNWTYSGTGATINSSNTNTASIDFSSTATGGTLSVTATNACGTSPARSVALLVNPRGNWLGTNNTDWFNTSNWSCPGLPLSSSSVSIPSSAAYQPIVGANGAVAGSINIQNGASLSLLNTYNLDVYNNWQNDGTLNAASNSTVSFKGTTTISGSSTNSFGNISISGTLTGPATGIMNISGNWTNTGTFTHNNGTVNFNGGSLQTITNTNGEQFNNLGLSNPVEIDIAPTTNLTVNGATTLSGNLVLKSSSAGTANLLNNGTITQTGTASVERYTAGAAFHYIASPMSATPSSNFNDMVSGPINRNFLIYDESLSSATFNDNWLNGWIPQLTAAAMTKGKGYALYYDGDRTYSFNGGTLNGATPATPITIPVTYNTHTWSSTVTTNNRIADGWNLIGNPYPCGLDANTFITANTGAINGSLYFWDEATPYTSWNLNGTDYACWNGAGTTGTGSGSFVPNGKISIGQGFFVKAKSGGTGSVAFTSNMRTVSAQHFFKGEKVIQRAMISVVNPQKEHNETLIAFIDDATDGFDDLYDGLKMKGNKNLALYSKLDGRDYAIQSFPSLAPEDTKTVNIGIDALVDGNYKFNLNRIELIDPAIHVYLIDKALNKKTDLRKTSVYECYLTSGIYNSRFKVVFTNKDLEIEPLPENPQMKVYASNHKVFVELPTEASSSQVRIFDVSGREIYNAFYQDQYQLTIPMDDKSGIYMVDVKYNGASKTTKVFLER